jgi:3-isopropylmalate dehydrogenase
VPFDELLDASPLKREIIEGTDILFFRELTGDVYFGESGRTGSGKDETAFQQMVYSVAKSSAWSGWPPKRLASVAII